MKADLRAATLREKQNMQERELLAAKISTKPKEK
jgi:hypothetical protein